MTPQQEAACSVLREYFPDISDDELVLDPPSIWQVRGGGSPTLAVAQEEMRRNADGNQWIVEVGAHEAKVNRAQAQQIIAKLSELGLPWSNVRSGVSTMNNVARIRLQGKDYKSRYATSDDGTQVILERGSRPTKETAPDLPAWMVAEMLLREAVVREIALGEIIRDTLPGAFPETVLEGGLLQPIKFSLAHRSGRSVAGYNAAPLLQTVTINGHEATVTAEQANLFAHRLDHQGIRHSH
jgi:hypothetical protein